MNKEHWEILFFIISALLGLACVIALFVAFYQLFAGQAKADKQLEEERKALFKRR